jgi:tripartite-type tricarboxylate transporter receptor subunit TctC
MILTFEILLETEWMLRSIGKITLWSFASLLCLPLLVPDTAQAYPDQPIKVIVTFPPGGSADIVIRALQPLLAKDLHQALVVENRSGAGGNIGIGAVAQAAPDGYTIGVAAAGVLTVNPHLNRAAMSFDPLKDLAPITLLAQIPFVLVASQQSNLSSVADVIASAKAHPGELSIGHGGNGTAMHLTSALFAQKAGIDIQLISYRGTAPATVDVLAGHIPLAVLDIPASQQLIRDGKLRAIGVSAAKRVAFLPEVAPLSELGLRDFESVGWFGLVAPAGTPPDIINRLNTAFVKALNDPAAAEKIRGLGAEPAPSTPEQFATFIRSESVKWGKLITDAGIKGE